MCELRSRLAQRLLIDRPDGRAADSAPAIWRRPPCRASTRSRVYFAGYLPALVLATWCPLTVLGWVARSTRSRE